jgi:hypothetical protein
LNDPLNPNSVLKLAAVRGLEIGVDQAEVLYVLRMAL